MKALHPDLVAAFNASKVHVATLAQRVGMPRNDLGRWMARGAVRDTRLARERLITLAALLAYTGEIFR